MGSGGPGGAVCWIPRVYAGCRRSLSASLPSDASAGNTGAQLGASPRCWCVCSIFIHVLLLGTSIFGRVMPQSAPTLGSERVAPTSGTPPPSPALPRRRVRHRPAVSPVPVCIGDARQSAGAAADPPCGDVRSIPSPAAPCHAPVWARRLAAGDCSPVGPSDSAADRCFMGHLSSRRPHSEGAFGLSGSGSPTDGCDKMPPAGNDRI